MIKDPETGKKRKVDEEYVAYKGRKGWGLEIEAVSGQQGGAQTLREIVLTEILKHLREENRLDEIKTPLWEEIGWDEDNNPFSKETWENYEKYAEEDWEDIKEFIIDSEHDELSQGRKIVWEAERKPYAENVELLGIEEHSLNLINYDIRQSIVNINDTTIELATIHLREQIEELEAQIRSIAGKIRTKGCVEEKLMLRWVRFNEINIMPLQDVAQDDLKAIDEPYDEDIEELKEQKEITDSIWVGSVVEWFDEVKDDLFVAKTNEEEELSFGLMPGVHMEVLKEGGDVSVLFAKVDEFDQERIYDYIWETAQNEGKEGVSEKLRTNLKVYRVDEEQEAWHEKWDQYLEVK